MEPSSAASAAMIAGTASLGGRSIDMEERRAREDAKAEKAAIADAPAPAADEQLPPMMRRQSTFARLSSAASAGMKKAPIPKFFRKGVIAVSSDAAGEIVARLAQNQPVSFRERLFLVMTEPTTSRAAKLVATVSWLIVLADGAATILETEASIIEMTGIQARNSAQRC